MEWEKCMVFILVNSSSDNGIAARADGILAASAYKSTANSGNVAIFNRTGTDGPIQSFYKSGTSVGSIGVKGTDLTIGNTVTGLQFYDIGNALAPVNVTTNANTDGATDLGLAGARFKDLYLSNSAYVKNLGGVSDPDTYINLGDTANTIKIFTGGQEAARIDASGSLLVGGISKTSIPSLDNGVYLQSQTNGDVLGYSLYSNEGTNNRRVAFFLDDTNGVYGFDSSAASGIPDFVIRRAGSEQMRLTSTGLGIGTSSPESRLSVLQSAVDGNALVLPMASGATDENFTSIRGKYSVGNEYCRGEVRFGVESFAIGSGFLAFATGTNTATERMRIDASGAVIVNNGGAGNGIIRINGATGNTEAVIFQRGGTEASRIGHANSADLAFYTGSGATERARLTGDGNFLVGTTSVQGAGGVTLSESGYVYSSRPSSTAIYADRTGSDGTIQEFRRDGTSVGSIGVVGGSVYIDGGSSNYSVMLASDFRPRTSNGAANNDAAVDLGDSSARWKDLYISGGVYLGGTGAANKLDDFEEGTWTPVTNSGSWTVNAASYTKVGNMVTCRFRVTATATIAANDFTGLPFIPAAESGGVCGYQNSEAGEVFSIAVQSVNVWNFRVSSTQKGLANGALVYGAFTYQTTA